MRIGLYFGSYNPIHNGHLAIARYALEFGNLDQLWFVVSPHNPLKEKDDLLDDEARLEMVNLAIKDTKGIFASDVEFSMPKPSYTVDTMGYLNKQYPEHQFVLLMGGDNLSCFHLWKDHQKLLENYDIIVYPRPGFDKTQVSGLDRVTIIDAPLMEISSTEIREKIKKNEDVSSLIPESVKHFIQKHKLYRAK